MTSLSTHVLDTANGCPAAGMRVTLVARDEPCDTVLESVTNGDGRLDGVMLTGAEYAGRRYTLRFAVADYFRRRGVDLPDPPFLDEVELHFGMAHDTHYHVPLLVSPWSYSTYRGS
jgi:5-hydroxyisourate hydrolase